MVLPCLSVIDYRESACLGGVQSEAVVDEKLREISVVEGFSLSLFWFVLQSFLFCLGRAFYKYLPMKIKSFFFPFCGQVRRTSCEFTICRG